MNCGCFQNTAATRGADTLARLYVLEGNGQLDSSSTNGIISNVVAYGYTVATLTCEQAFVNQQTLDLECLSSAGPEVANNVNCKACIALAQKVAADRQKLEEEAHAINPLYVEQRVSSNILSAYLGVSGDTSDGICKYVCRQCVFENLSQNIQMRLIADCDSNTKQFTSAFVQGMSAQAEKEISAHQEALKTTGVNIQNQDDIKSMSIEMSNTIFSMTTVKMRSALKQHALNVQSMKIDPNSTSVMIQNGSQGITTSMFASIVSRVFNDTSVKTSINFDSRQTDIQIETSFSDLIKTLETTVNDIETLLLNTVGKVMVTLLAMIMMIMFVFAALFFFKPGFLFGGVGDSEDIQDT
jgi:hypothetical protein